MFTLGLAWLQTGGPYFESKNTHFFVNNKTKHSNDQTIYEQSLTHILVILHHVLHFAKIVNSSITHIKITW